MGSLRELAARLRAADEARHNPSPVDQARRLLAGTGYVVARDVRPTFDGLDAWCDGWNAACEAMRDE